MIEQTVRELLEQVRTIAVVGASNKPQRASYRVMAFLQRCGYKVIPVNPVLEGQTLHNEVVRGSLTDISEKIDMVDIFRQSAEAGVIVDEAIAMNAKAVWLQLGVVDDQAKTRAENAGLIVVMDRCPKIDIPALSIETPSEP